MKKSKPWKVLRGSQLAVLAGIAFTLSAVQAFGVIRSRGLVGILNSTIGLVLILAAMTLMVWALVRSYWTNDTGQVGLLLGLFSILALGVLFLALIPDPVPFISALTSTLAGVLASWVVFDRERIFGHRRQGTPPRQGHKTARTRK